MRQTNKMLLTIWHKENLNTENISEVKAAAIIKLRNAIKIQIKNLNYWLRSTKQNIKTTHNISSHIKRDG